MLIKPEVVSTQVNAQVSYPAESPEDGPRSWPSDTTVPTVVHFDKLYSVYMLYSPRKLRLRWLWRRSACGCSHRASTTSDTPRLAVLAVSCCAFVRGSLGISVDISLRVEATRLDYFIQLQKAVITATSSAKCRDLQCKKHTHRSKAEGGRIGQTSHSLHQVAASERALGAPTFRLHYIFAGIFASYFSQMFIIVGIEHLVNWRM